MRTLLISIMMATFLPVAAFTQMEGTQIGGKEVAGNDDVVFHQIDAHTWVGTGHTMYNESVYLVEGDTKAVLIDAGAKISDLDKIVAAITKKPLMLVATHAHPDHTGSATNYFPELYIAPGDATSQFVANYTGKIKELKDGETIDLGERTLEVVFTPGHTPDLRPSSIRKQDMDSAVIRSVQGTCFYSGLFPRFCQPAGRPARSWRSMGSKSSIRGIISARTQKRRGESMI